MGTKKAHVKEKERPYYLLSLDPRKLSTPKREILKAIDWIRSARKKPPPLKMMMPLLDEGEIEFCSVEEKAKDGRYYACLETIIVKALELDRAKGDSSSNQIKNTTTMASQSREWRGLEELWLFQTVLKDQRN